MSDKALYARHCGGNRPHSNIRGRNQIEVSVSRDVGDIVNGLASLKLIGKTLGVRLSATADSLNTTAAARKSARKMSRHISRAENDYTRHVIKFVYIFVYHLPM